MVASGLRKLRFPLLYAALGFAWLIDYLKCPLDADIGNVVQVDGPTLISRLQDKSVLIVGGTRGIGRGVAIAMARGGANVEIVGRSTDAGDKVVRFMRATAARPSEQMFGAQSADLSTVAGCLKLAEKLKEEAMRFDYVVFTVSSWPDRVDPKTADGVDRVVALNLVARFVIMREVMPLLNKGARILNVLASTQRLPFPSVEDIKDIVSGERDSYWIPQMLASAGISLDALLQQAASHYPEVKFIGTYPGIVPTNLILSSNSFPVWLSTFASATVGWLSRTPLPNVLTEEQSGEVQVQILSSPNAAKRAVTYFNYLMEGRQVNEQSYDKDFGEWLWSFLERTAEKHAPANSSHT